MEYKNYKLRIEAGTDAKDTYGYSLYDPTRITIILENNHRKFCLHTLRSPIFCVFDKKSKKINTYYNKDKMWLKVPSKYLEVLELLESENLMYQLNLLNDI